MDNIFDYVVGYYLCFFFSFEAIWTSKITTSSRGNNQIKSVSNPYIGEMAKFA